MKTCGSRASARCAAPERCVRPSRCRQSRPRSARGRSGARKSCLRQPEQFSTDPSGRRPRGARWRAQRARPRCSAGTCRACGISGAFSDSACRAVGSGRTLAPSFRRHAASQATLRSLAELLQPDTRASSGLSRPSIRRPSSASAYAVAAQLKASCSVRALQAGAAAQPQWAAARPRLRYWDHTCTAQVARARQAHNRELADGQFVTASTQELELQSTASSPFRYEFIRVHVRTAFVGLST